MEKFIVEYKGFEGWVKSNAFSHEYSMEQFENIKQRVIERAATADYRIVAYKKEILFTTENQTQETKNRYSVKFYTVEFQSNGLWLRSEEFPDKYSVDSFEQILENIKLGNSFPPLKYRVIAHLDTGDF